MNRKLWTTCLCLSVIVIVLLASGTALAQAGYPYPVDKYVNDYAGVLEPKHKDDMRAQLADLDAETGIEATVLTVGSIYDYGTGDATIESFATNLFNTWGIGDRAKNDGLLILVAVRDRQVRIEVGSGYGSSLDGAMQCVIDETMVPHFAREEYSIGIYEGTLAAVAEATGDSSRDGAGRISIDFDDWFGPLMVLLTLIGVVWLMAKTPAYSSFLARKRPRRGRSGKRTYWGGGSRGGGGSSGGGGGFGGGGSSGGGASGSW